jgi:hypothetical protein
MEELREGVTNPAIYPTNNLDRFMGQKRIGICNNRDFTALKH